MVKRIFIFVTILGIQFSAFGWTSEGHKRLAEEILSHPTISQMITTAGLNKNRIIKFCKDGDKYAAHDLYDRGGWYDAFNSWQNFKSQYLNDAQIGNVRKDMPSEWKNPPEAYDLSEYWKNVETVIPGATHVTTNNRGQVVTIQDPSIRTYTWEKYWIDQEQMFGLFLHNLTDCAVPVNHNPAASVFQSGKLTIAGIEFDEKPTEDSFEATAYNNDIPSYPEITFITEDELSILLPNGNNTTDAEFNAFWANSLSSIFEKEIQSCAEALKQHVGGQGSTELTTSEWLTPRCFKALLKFAVPVVYKYVEYTNAYISHTGKQPGYTIPTFSTNKPKVNADITPIINLLLD